MSPAALAPALAPETLALTALRDADRATLVTLLADPEIARRSPQIPFPYTPENARQWIRAARERQLRFGRPMVWAIRDGSERLLGCVAFRAAHPKAREAELGYWLAREAWGKGIMSVVLRQLVVIAFERYGWHTLTARVLDGNAASVRVLEKTGFSLAETGPGAAIYRLRRAPRIR